MAGALRLQGFMVAGVGRFARLSPNARGLLFGALAVIIWGSYLAFARAGVSSGLTGFDFTAIRYGTAGLVMLPWLLRHQTLTMDARDRDGDRRDYHKIFRYAEPVGTPEVVSRPTDKETVL